MFLKIVIGLILVGLVITGIVYTQQQQYKATLDQTPQPPAPSRPPIQQQQQENPGQKFIEFTAPPPTNK